MPLAMLTAPPDPRAAPFHGPRTATRDTQGGMPESTPDRFTLRVIKTRGACELGDWREPRAYYSSVDGLLSVSTVHVH